MKDGSANVQRLVGDIGGTNVRLALADPARPEQLSDIREYRVADFARLEDALAKDLEQRGGEPPAEAVVAVAGPVLDGAIRMTNADWTISEAGLCAFGFQRAKLLNDFSALSLALPYLTREDLAVIGPDRDGAPGATAAVIGAGTGLGVGALVRDGSRLAVAVSEGGHVAFAPDNEAEMDLLRELTVRFGRVSLERILSGPGLVNLHQAVSAIRGRPSEDVDPKSVVERAEAGDELAQEVLDRFCAIYGGAAGDLALTFGARGGVYLGGGIPPRIVDMLRASAFRERFEAKGRFRDYLAAIPTFVILHPHAALVGAAAASLGRHYEVSSSG